MNKYKYLSLVILAVILLPVFSFAEDYQYDSLNRLVKTPTPTPASTGSPQATPTPTPTPTAGTINIKLATPTPTASPLPTAGTVNIRLTPTPSPTPSIPVEIIQLELKSIPPASPKPSPTNEITGTVKNQNQGSNLRTNCDSQPKPAIDCPPGYTMMCNPTGGDHWSCGKESRGQIIEWTGGESERELDPAVSTEEACQAKCRDQYGGSGSQGYEACIRACGAAQAYQHNQTDLEFLKTMANRLDFEVNFDEGLKDFKPATQSAGIIKKVEVRGWDPEKKRR